MKNDLFYRLMCFFMVVLRINDKNADSNSYSDTHQHSKCVTIHYSPPSRITPINRKRIKVRKAKLTFHSATSAETRGVMTAMAKTILAQSKSVLDKLFCCSFFNFMSNANKEIGFRQRTRRAQRLFRMLFGFFPVLTNGNNPNRNGEKSNADHRNNSKICTGHRFPPLSKTVAIYANRVTTMPPTIITAFNVFAGATIGPKTLIARTNFAASYKNFAKFSLCFFVNSIIRLSLIKTRGVCQERTRMTQRLFRMLFGFFPVLMNNDYHKAYSAEKQRQKNNCNFIHLVAPLSSRYPRIKNAKNNIMPMEKFNKVTASGDNIRPAINIANIIWLKLRQNLERFSLRLSVNSIIYSSLIKTRGVCQERMTLGIERWGTQR